MASHTLTDTDEKNRQKGRQISKPTTIDLVGGIYCHICQLTYAKKKEYDNHYAQHKTDGEDIIYTCVICQKQIKSYPSFRGHCYTIHVIKDRHKCEYCSKYFSKFATLKEHIKIFHTFKCSTCSKQFSSKNELQLHQIIHNDSDAPPYHCQVCEKQIATLDGCKDHIDMHTVYIYFCPICNENISSRDNAADHLKKHFTKTGGVDIIDVVQKSDSEETSIEKLGGISCNYCILTYKNRVEFDAHFSSQHGDKDIVYVCIVCEKDFDKYSVFADHAYNHFTKDRFCCSICLKTFNRLSILSTHMVVCQADSEASGKPFACPECGHRYGTEMRLRQHLQDVHGIHCIKCPVDDCQKTFASPKDLIFHQYIHNPDQNWCRQCGLPFTSLISCERHLDVHKKKLFGCPVCNRNYSEKYLLKNHITQHFESTLHICKVCGKVYNHKRRFMDHLKTHNESKLYNCTYCEKGFQNLSRLQQHLNTHTGSKPYKCTICSKTFASYPNWFKHKSRMHKFDSKLFVKSDENNTEDDEEYIRNAVIDKQQLPKLDEKGLADNIQYLNDDISYLKDNDDILDNNISIDDSDENLNTIVYAQEDSPMEPETIDHIEIEKELQILEEIQANAQNGNVELCDVLATNEPIFDDADIEETPNAVSSSEPANYPPEYGPEFTVGDSCGFLDLDDHMLPHIDPLLTIKTEDFNMLTQKDYESLVPPMDPGTYQMAPKWEPPIFTKVCQEYTYGYGDMVDTNRLSIMNTDIF